MKKENLIERLDKGELCMPVEYRNTKTDEIHWRDKQTGAAKTAVLLKHTVEFGTMTAIVNERLPEGATKQVADGLAMATATKFKKGARCILVADEFRVERGIAQVRGKLETLEV